MNEIQPTTSWLDFSDMGEDAAYLREKAFEYAGIEYKSRFEKGRVLEEIHQRYADHDKNKGQYDEFCRKMGIPKTTAYREKNFYNYVVSNWNDMSEIPDLLNGQFDALASGKANPQLAEAVKNGEVKNSKEYKEMQKRLAEAEEQAKQAKDEAFVATNDKRRAELRAEQMEKSNENLRNKCDAQAQEIQELKDNPVVVETPANPEYIAQLKDEAAKAKAQARKANLDFENLQDALEKLDKRGGDAIRERDKYAQMAEEIAGELKQAQELNARLLAERKQSNAETDIAILLATATRQINDENLELCVRRILRLNDGEIILRRFKEMADIACIKGD